MQEKEQIFSPIKQRILQYVDTLSISKRDFYAKTGISRGTLESKTGITEETISKFLATYGNVSPEWLISGKGPVENSSLSNVRSSSSYKEKVYEEQCVPLYDLEAVAGLKVLFDNGKENILDLIRIPHLPKCDGAVYVTGDSMYPLLKSGDIVLYKEISDIRNNIFFGEMYLLSLNIEGDEYITVKYLHKSEQKEYIKLVSYNQHHEPKDVPMSAIQALAIIKASIRMNTMR